jgi:hypothetical protein
MPPVLGTDGDPRGCGYRSAKANRGRDSRATPPISGRVLNELHITSITATSGPVVVSLSTFSSDQSTLDKSVGGFDVSDGAANVLWGLPTAQAPSASRSSAITTPDFVHKMGPKGSTLITYA